MFEVLVNQVTTMSLAEEVHTLLFTAFLIIGARACLRRPDKRFTLRPTMPARTRKPTLVR
jgi:hypothetical protein